LLNENRAQGQRSFGPAPPCQRSDEAAHLSSGKSGRCGAERLHQCFAIVVLPDSSKDWRGNGNAALTTCRNAEHSRKLESNAGGNHKLNYAHMPRRQENKSRFG
jgi:hypothetical protein